LCYVASSDVHNCCYKESQPATEVSDKAHGQYFNGVGSTEEHMVILLDLNEGLIEDQKALLSIR